MILVFHLTYEVELVEHVHVYMEFLKVAAALHDTPENFLILPISEKRV